MILNDMRIIGILLVIALMPLGMHAGEKITGTVIGTELGYNYEKGKTERDIQMRAFDGDLSTYFATYHRSYTWVGLDLGTPHVIDRVGWAPRNDGVGPERMRLGVFQGANSPDFLDAVPIYLIPDNAPIGQMSYGDVDCSRGFRYVRFVSTGDHRCNVAELEFYGTPGEGDDSKLYQITNLPTVCINTVDSQEPYDKVTEIIGNVVIIDGHRIDVDKPATVRERGNASRDFPKKPWRIKFDKKQNVLDAPAKAKKWTLINNYGDKTLLRNLLAFEIARRLGMTYVPYGRAVDVVLNGEYKGCYQLCDQIEVKEGRVDITEMTADDIAGEALTGGYLFEVDAYADREPAGEWFKTRRLGMPVTIKSPDDGGTTEQYNYIKNYFSEVEDMLMSGKYGQNGGESYRERFDVDSFLRHMLVGELSGNTDTYWSTYMYKERGDDCIYTGPVWDFDIAFDNDTRTYPIHTRVGSSRWLFESSLSSEADGMRTFARRIVRSDPASSEEITRIWSLARNEHDLTTESLRAYIDALAEELEASQRLNFVRWPILNVYVQQNPIVSGSYSGEVQRVKKYIGDRIKDIDKLAAYSTSITSMSDGALAQAAPAVHRKVMLTSAGVISPATDRSFEVYTVYGARVFSGTGSTPVLKPGTYVVVLR